MKTTKFEPVLESPGGYAFSGDWMRPFIGCFGLECTFWEVDKFLWIYYNNLKTDSER